MSTETIISVTGLGYVGIPLAVAFAKKYKVIGLDINETRVQELRDCIDRTNEVSPEELKTTNVQFTTKGEDLKEANFHIVTVPTPVNEAQQPDLTALIKASEALGKILKQGDIVVYESTVYPGATEEDCVPVLEKFSGLKFGKDFKVGYSPERINPGDKEHTFTKIKKVVAGQDQESLDKIADVYGSVVEAGIYKAASIKVAEAAKVIENSQRDINIAFMNELSLIFKKMDIDTKEVLAAAGTKWNFLNFTPGLVGGHCIGVDPYYLTYKSKKLGYHPHVILSGRRINDGMGNYVAQQVVEIMIQKQCKLTEARINLLGLTFKENCPDVRNTKVVDIYKILKRLGLTIDLYDPHAHKDDIQAEFGDAPKSLDELQPADLVILGAPHKELVTSLPKDMAKFAKAPNLFVDVRGALDPSIVGSDGIYWRL